LDLTATDPAGALEFAPPTQRLSLAAGEQRQVVVTARVRPAPAGWQAQPFRFIVTARAPDDPPRAPPKPVSGTLDYVPPTFRLALEPPQRRGRSGRFALTITNESLGELTLLLEAADATGGCLVELSSRQVTVPAHAQAQVPV